MPAQTLTVTGTALLQQVEAYLEQPPQTPMPLRGYLLVDGALRQEIIRQYFMLDETPRYLPLFLGIDDDNLSECPYLIELHPGSALYLDWLSAEYPGTAFAFLSPYDLDQQLPFWQSLLTVRHEDDSCGYFRFFDGQVAQALYVHGTEQEKRQLFQPCYGLFFQEDNQGWLYQPNEFLSDSMADDLPVPGPAPWLILSEQTLATLTQSGHESRQAILNFLWQHYPAQLNELTHEELQARIQEAESLCLKLAIDGWKYRALFNCLMVERGNAFLQLPAVARIFQQEQAIGGTAWGERALDRLAAELPLKELSPA